MQAGGEFLKAVANDLAVLAAWLRQWLIAIYQVVKVAARNLAVRISRLVLSLAPRQHVLKAAASDFAVRVSTGPGGRTLRAGGAFLKAAAGDLAALASRLRLLLLPKLQLLKAAAGDLAARRSRLGRWPIATDRPTLPSRTSAPNRISEARSAGRTLRRFGFALLGLGAIGTLALSGAMLWALLALPVELRGTSSDTPGLLLEAANGEKLGRIGPLKVAEASRQDFPEHLVQAVLSIEDRRFYSHFGIDPEAILRALRRNLAAGEVVEGGSTITQQLLKVQFLSSERTFARKLREALAAIWLDLRLEKDEILTRYLNSIYLGAGAYGMPAAARLYFDKTVQELALPEAAMLAGLIRAPSLYNPMRNPEAARQRTSLVLDAMVASGAIDEPTAANAKTGPVALRPAPEASPVGSWFADWVKQELVDVTGSFNRSMRVRTTLIPGLQQLAEEVVEEVLIREGERAGVTQAALVAMRPDGAVLAMVGGRDYRESQFNRAVEANRHPGSIFKLFVYLAALRQGFTPQDVIDAGPVEINGWQPENFDGRTYGRITLADAFAQSVNTAAVALAMEVGLDDVIAAAYDLGVEAPLPKVPSLALGAVEVGLLELTGAFASVRAGMRVKPWGVVAAGPDDQSPLRVWGPPIRAVQPLGPSRDQMIEMLRLAVERGTGRAAALPGFAAGKTGTSQNHRDAWFIGFNEPLVVGVWVGNDDGTPMRQVVGGSLPATIWRRFVGRATGLVGSERAPAAEARTETVPAASSGASSPAQCDYRACARAYRSFRASDCTYQPYSGPRRICER
ncbi:MAG: PBP1A family penicillin-binding protein [Alphaproteobacteria bacterium]